MMENTVVRISAGRTAGIFTCQATRHPEQPSITAASVSSPGIACKAE